VFKKARAREERMTSIPNSLFVDETKLHSVDDYENRFAEIAAFVMNQCDLVVANKVRREVAIRIKTCSRAQTRFHLAETEFYFTSDHHKDPFNHCDDRQ
jgi:hypothetical protein